MKTTFTLSRRAALGLAAGAWSLGVAMPAAADVDFSGQTSEWIIPV